MANIAEIQNNILSDSGVDVANLQPLLTNPVTGTGTAGQVAYFNGTTTQTGSNLMFWDATNNRLGIWTSIPSELLHVAGNMRFDGVMRDNRSNTIIAQSASNITTNRTLTFGNATYKDIIFPSSNVLIGNTDGTGRLTVRGSGTTSATTALLVQNSTPTELFKVLDNGHTSIGPTVSDFISTNTLFINSSQPTIFLYRNTNALNQKAIHFFVNSLGDLQFRTRFDANNTGADMLVLTRSGNLTITNGGNFVFGTTTGTKIGTATTEKLSFWNATPVAQPTGNIVDALSTIGLVATPTLYTSATATLTTAGWSLVSGLYEQSISDANITATSLVNVIPDNADYQTVVNAEFLPRTDSAAGSVKVYAKNLPTANIGVTIIILK